MAYKLGYLILKKMEIYFLLGPCSTNNFNTDIFYALLMQQLQFLWYKKKCKVLTPLPFIYIYIFNYIDSYKHKMVRTLEFRISNIIR